MTEQITETTGPATDETLLDEAVSGPPVGEGSTNSVSGTTASDDPETFPREYVVKLRDESARNRQRAADGDALAARLHAALVAATGRLADPSDLPFDDARLDDAEALTTVLDDLLARKPHLASRKPSGDVGQGAGSGADGFSLAGMLRTRA